jgi:MYXO-CTERM domain-containing protein
MLLAATALLMAPATAVAQNTADDIVYTDDTERQEEDDGNSRLGLLGLLGLAGLLGLMRREPDIHVDARRDTRD